MIVRNLVVGLLSTNCVLASYETGVTVIFDPGAEGKRIMSVIRENGLEPAAIVLTHGHYDHMLAAEELRSAYHIPVLIDEKEKELVEDTFMNLSVPFTGNPAAVSPDRTFKNGDVLSFGDLSLLVMETPGHTAGSCCFYEEKEGILFSGDTLFYQSVGRTDFPTGDTAVLVRSIVDILYRLPDETVLYPGHGPKTTIGAEKRDGMIPHR